MCLLLTCVDRRVAADQKPASSSSDNSLLGSISIRSVIEQYDSVSKLYKTKLIVEESYWRVERRAVVQIVESNSTNRYYHDANSGVWLDWSPGSGKCKPSSQADLDRRLFGGALIIDDPDSAPLSAQDDQLKHVVGPARVLLVLQKLKPRLTLSELSENRSMHGRIVIPFRLVLESTSGAHLQLDVLYDQAQMRQMPLLDTLPLQLILTRDQPINSMLSFSFAQFQRVDSKMDSYMNFVNGVRVQSPSGFPLKPTCERVVGAQESPQTPERGMLRKLASSFDKISFKAKLIDNLRPTDQAVRYYRFIFDQAKKLLRKDHFLSGERTIGKAVSTTLYDFNRGRKFNLLKRDPHQPRRSSNLVDEDDTAGCVTIEMDYERKMSGYLRKVSQHLFVDIEGLRYMGRADLGTKSALVYKQDAPIMLPFWLFPAVLVKRTNSEPQEVSELQAINGLGNVISLSYYFALKEQTRFMPEPILDQLLRVEIAVIDSIRNLPLLMKTLEITDFTSGAVASGLFSLVADCPSKDDKSARFSVVLEPTQRDGIQNEAANLYYADEYLGSNLARDELLLDSLFRSFQLSPIYIEHFKSRPLLRPSKRFALREKQWLSLPRLEFELEVRDSTGAFKEAECTLLGRGRFFNREQVLRNQVNEFEECLWFAHHHSLELGHELLFAYDTKSSLCLLDRLYLDQSGRRSSAKTVNYYPYEYGDFIMYKLTYEPPGSESTRSDSILHSANLPMIGNKALHLVGQSVSLAIPNVDYQIPYRIEHVKMSGQLARADGTLQHNQRVNNVAWMLSDGLVRAKVLGEDSYLPGGQTGVHLMTDAICCSSCLLDIECRSYSFCERSIGKQAECLLSKVDITRNGVLQQLQSHSAASKPLQVRKSEQPQQLDFRQTSDNNGTDNIVKISINIDSKCYISSKSYSTLFVRTYQYNVKLGDQSLEKYRVVDRDECARHCFEKNIDFLKSIREYELNSIIMKDDLEALFDWYPQHAKSLCVRFQYAEQADGQEGPSCFIPKTYQKIDETPTVGEVQANSVVTDTHKLIFTNLFERKDGLRLAAAKEVLPSKADLNTTGKNANTRNVKITVLESRLNGLNEQIKLGIDDVEHCARSCLMQLNGPRPSCASFDLVLERSTGQRYCLLNTQSLRSLKMHKDESSRQVIYASTAHDQQYWHFEPLLYSTDDKDDVYDALNAKILAELVEESNMKSTPLGIYIFIVFIAMIGGLFASISMTGFLLQRQERSKRIDSVSSHRMARLVHTLRKVSLRTRYESDEIRM